MMKLPAKTEAAINDLYKTIYYCFFCRLLYIARYYKGPINQLQDKRRVYIFLCGQEFAVS